MPHAVDRRRVAQLADQLGAVAVGQAQVGQQHVGAALRQVDAGDAQPVGVADAADAGCFVQRVQHVLGHQRIVFDEIDLQHACRLLGTGFLGRSGGRLPGA